MFCTFFSFSNFSTCCANSVFCWSACWDDDTSYCHKKKQRRRRKNSQRKRRKKMIRGKEEKRGQGWQEGRCEKIKVSQNPCLWLWAKKNCEGTSNEEEKCENACVLWCVWWYVRFALVWFSVLRFLLPLFACVSGVPHVLWLSASEALPGLGPSLLVISDRSKQQKNINNETKRNEKKSNENERKTRQEKQ